jgi:propanol-preferring alcohol dehydrogenase
MALSPLVSLGIQIVNFWLTKGSQQDTKEIRVDRIPVPEILPNEVLVRMGAASLCHSEIMMIDGHFPGPSVPTVLGHEGVGTIEKVGTEVKGFNEGDRVGFLPTKDCCCR